jgi:predicted O-linked N-acetylglucosamine transferase (SPINDLY family)
MPELPDPYVNLAYIELRKGCPDSAIEFYRMAIDADSSSLLARSFLLFASNLIDDIDPKELFEEHRRFGELLENRTSQRIHEFTNSTDAARAIRVGYVSGDYKVHPVAQFITPLLEDHDPELVRPFCYSNTRQRDEVTEEMERRFAPIWRDVAAMSDDDFASLVIEDEIDILVDLSGHTGDSRLAVFARKPAPIQVAWLGYLNTTCLKSIDYRLVDQYTDPVGVADDLNTERLVRLPDSQWAYWPIFEVPIMRAERSSNAREILFGSFNQFAKLSDRTLELWGQIMRSLPDARLRVAGLPPGNMEEHLRRRLEKVGIDGTRVLSAVRLPQMQYLQSFNEVDIALDSMPYNGATTTLDTLWMGVPVVGLVGTRSISRGTYSILKTLGMDDLIAESPAQYVELNVRLAKDADWRDELHRSLREKLRRSPLMDTRRFVENLESAYRGMWHEWCESQRRPAAT